MARVTVSIGSNIDRDNAIRAGVRELARRYGPLSLSTVYESEAVGFEGDNFYNLVAAFDCELPVGELAAELRAIEEENGRVRGAERFSSRTLDIDLLTYDGLSGEHDGVQLPREEITRNAFVLWPLAEICPDERYPLNGQRYAELWAAFDKTSQPLWPIAFDFTEAE